MRGLAVDHRSDIFSFGSLLHEMLTGKKAFHRDSVADTMSAITRDEPASAPDGGALAPGLDLLVKHCLEKRPEDRYQSAKDLAFGLAQVASRAMPNWPLPAAVAATSTATEPRHPATASPSRRPLVFAGVGLAIAVIAVFSVSR